jgi:hypothetical protein
MVRRRKGVDWSQILEPEDLIYLRMKVAPDEWYPMETFERLGVAILAQVEQVTLDTVRLWGRFSAREFAGDHPELIAANEPLESLMRLKVMRSTLFDFPAFDVPLLTEGYAELRVNYYMGARAEEAACQQTLGFCEEVLALAGANVTRTVFVERAWAGKDRTLISLEWT